MLTVFSIPKAFRGHIGVIQRNAIRSWMKLHPEVEIILFGSDEGTAETAREFGLRHEPSVERNEFRSMLVSSVFGKAQAIARYEAMCYVNCDIVLMQDFVEALTRVKAAHQEFLMVGQRWDADITEPLKFEQTKWEDGVREFVSRHGKQRGPDWIDYFAFSRGMYGADTPPFAIGRTCWDNWLVWRVLDAKKPVVDASNVVLAVHQNHDYSHHPEGAQGAWHGEEAGRNAQLAGGWDHLRTSRDANVTATAEGLRSNKRRYWLQAKRRLVQSPLRFLRFRVWNPMWFAALNLSRPLRAALGLRATTKERH